MARKNGCPFSVRNWMIEVLSCDSTETNQKWLRVKGLSSMDYSTEAETEDGSTGDSLWGEPYVTKRNGSFTLEGKPVADVKTGARDKGQAELDYYATLGGIDGDTKIRLADPHGRAMELDVIVTNAKRGADDTSETVSWEMKQVGESTELSYVPVTGVTIDKGATASLNVGQTMTMNVSVAPANASNQKYTVHSANPGAVRVCNVDGLTFELIGVAASSDAVDVVIKTMNGQKTATVAVTVN